MATKGQILQGLEANIINYQSTDHDILWEALHVPGAPIRDVGGRNMADGNKRLALVGDAIARAILIMIWYPTAGSRAMATDNVRNQLSNGNLANVARSHGLEAYIQQHPGQFGPLGNGPMADTIEAIIGAVWEDSKSVDTVLRVMRTLGLA